jgi:hypothetical protein
VAAPAAAFGLTLYSATCSFAAGWSAQRRRALSAANQAKIRVCVTQTLQTALTTYQAHADSGAVVTTFYSSEEVCENDFCS